MHVITGLSTGGAELMLLKLLGAMKRMPWEPTVLSLRDAGTIGARLVAEGVTVTCAGMMGAGVLSAPLRVVRHLRDARPDLVQGWMYHGNLAATLAGPEGTAVLWNIRQSFAGFQHEKTLTGLVIRLGAWLSSRPRWIIYNSEASARQHEAIGFDPRRTVIIPNGFDTLQYHPDPEAPARLRARLGLGAETILIGQVARYHPMKNHAGLLRAAARVVAKVPAARFLLAGANVDTGNTALTEALVAAGLGDHVRLLGADEEIPTLMPGLDILCSPSLWGEGFPNVLGEALACGTVCVATDVGDSRHVVGDGGRIVPPGDEAALATAIVDLAELTTEARRALGARGRNRVMELFDLAVVASQYRRLYDDAIMRTR
jgi:glycosyltransferase involved in cell wall biosynthesis